MIVDGQTCSRNGITYVIRSARLEDASELSAVRLLIDGETENMDREPGESYIDADGFAQLIRTDAGSSRNLFLVAETERGIAGFSRVQGNELKRFTHKAEFGVGVLKAYWGYGIGRQLLERSLQWADNIGIMKMNLNVLESNIKAISLYMKFGFETEAVLKKDKRLSDGRYYNTIIMSRFRR
ncbi:GNAT family acetyltransferase [Paenibacillus stellifer]|uniref:GNAT family acetyltransferase n=1 Tax=Paenibacillus stellifer TaxID=169760 RepID=A0A089LV40_9BACL|nr:GNAT family N-acetyltransferase [Paenibacillus stellifer]AIQ63990.1 GNAT family acetyltransferase [Paenibacillus stellifer]